jgi:hypothetical protein
MFTKTKLKLRGFLVRKRTITTERPPLVGEVRMFTKTKLKLRGFLVRKRTITTERPPLVGEVRRFTALFNSYFNLFSSEL